MKMSWRKLFMALVRKALAAASGSRSAGLPKNRMAGIAPGHSASRCEKSLLFVAESVGSGGARLGLAGGELLGRFVVVVDRG